MTTFADLVELTQRLVRRPDLSAVIDDAVRAATRKAHGAELFPRDLVVAQLSYVPSISIPFSDIPDLATKLPRYRLLKAVAMMSGLGGIHKEFLELRTQQGVYDSDGFLRTSSYVLIGDTLRIYPAWSSGVVEISFYQVPVVTVAGYKSWIADLYPEELAYWAAAIVYNRTGATEQAEAMYNRHILPFKTSLSAYHI